mgnify:CR=1 FL=1
MQKQLGKVHASVQNSPIIVTNNGMGSFIVLPYFDDSDEAIDRYLEDYEMQCNKELLKESYRESKESGVSDFSIAA